MNSLVLWPACGKCAGKVVEFLRRLRSSRGALQQSQAICHCSIVFKRSMRADRPRISCMPDHLPGTSAPLHTHGRTSSANPRIGVLTYCFAHINTVRATHPSCIARAKQSLRQHLAHVDAFEVIELLFGVNVCAGPRSLLWSAVTVLF